MTLTGPIPSSGVRPKRRSSRELVLIILSIVVLVASVGSYEAYRVYHSTNFPSSQCENNTTSSPYVINYLCGGFGIGVLIIHNTTVNVFGNGSDIHLTINASNLRLDLNVPGSYNTISIDHGQTNIYVSGRFNTIEATHTVVLQIKDTGSNNTIQK